MKKILSIVCFCLLNPIVLLASCAKDAPCPSGGLPAASLKSAGLVYAEFSKRLSSEPRDNDFTKFASDPSNYKVVVTKYNDAFVYTFFIE